MWGFVSARACSYVVAGRLADEVSSVGAASNRGDEGGIARLPFESETALKENVWEKFTD